VVHAFSKFQKLGNQYVFVLGKSKHNWLGRCWLGQSYANAIQAKYKTQFWIQERPYKLPSSTNTKMPSKNYLWFLLP
jgi:hypothetical protein